MKSIRHFWRSKRHAFRGIRYTFQNEKNFQTQVIIAIVVVGLMVFFGVRTNEVILITLLIFGVLILELFNTAIEVLSDIVKPRLHEQVKVVKDISAGMVLLASIAAVIIGGVIFYPYIAAFL